MHCLCVWLHLQLQCTVEGGEEFKCFHLCKLHNKPTDAGEGAFGLNSRKKEAAPSGNK